MKIGIDSIPGCCAVLKLYIFIQNLEKDLENISLCKNSALRQLLVWGFILGKGDCWPICGYLWWILFQSVSKDFPSHCYLLWHSLQCDTEELSGSISAKLHHHPRGKPGPCPLQLPTGAWSCIRNIFTFSPTSDICPCAAEWGVMVNGVVFAET